MSRVFATAALGISFIGWALLLSGTAYQQQKVGGNSLNFPVRGAVRTSWTKTNSSMTVLNTVATLKVRGDIPGYGALDVIDTVARISGFAAVACSGTNPLPSGICSAATAVVAAFETEDVVGLGVAITAMSTAVKMSTGAPMAAWVATNNTEFNRNVASAILSFRTRVEDADSSTEADSGKGWGVDDVGGSKNNPLALRPGVLAINPFTGESMNSLLVSSYWWPSFSIYSSQTYAWWLVAFQLITLCVAAVSIFYKPRYALGTAMLAGVLAASTFLYTSELFNSPAGIYALTHGPPPEHKTIFPSVSSLGPNGMSYFRGLAATFAGAVAVDAGNALLVLALPLVFIDHIIKPPTVAMETLLDADKANVVLNVM
jgi:hypothetical protein